GCPRPSLPAAPNAAGAPAAPAAARPAHDPLASLYPQQTMTFDAALAATLAGVPDGPAETRGVAVGAYVAAQILAARANDNSDAMMMYTPTPLPGHHQPDPLHPDQGFLTPDWGAVTPFTVSDITAFRPPPPPALGSVEYAAAYWEVALLGGDGKTTPTLRTAEQTQVGLFWGYDGSPGLGTPPRLYNQVVRVVAQQEHNTVFENARLFALVNLAMADAGICCWDAKYVYDFWPPVVALRRGAAHANPLAGGLP